MKVDIAIIGGGPAGLAAAISAWEAGARDILILERDHFLGGILNQCIHSGFGLHRFKEELTGPEYAHRYISRVEELGIPYKLDTTVLDISPDKTVLAVNSSDGMLSISAGAVILAMGCRERPRGAINIHGTRPAGVLTAGTAQRYVNLEGYMPGREVVVLGSGDIGLIMARRMTLEGAKVKAVVELMPYSGGLRRNIVQCLDDYGIPLYYSHTVTAIHGRQRLRSVEIARVDDALHPIPGTERDIPCDTLLLSVGLLPENELSKCAGVELSPVTGGPVVGESLQTGREGIFACGNVLHVHDLVDFVSEESAFAGQSAARYIAGEAFISPASGGIRIKPGAGVRYAVPAAIHPQQIQKYATVRFRVDQIYRDHKLIIEIDGERVREQAKRICAPGEMETVVLPKAMFDKHPGATQVLIGLEDAK